MLVFVLVFNYYFFKNVDGKRKPKLCDCVSDGNGGGAVM